MSVALVGARSPEEFRQTVARAKTYKPLEASEAEALDKRGKAMAAQWGPLRGPAQHSRRWARELWSGALDLALPPTCSGCSAAVAARAALCER